MSGTSKAHTSNATPSPAQNVTGQLTTNTWGTSNKRITKTKTMSMGSMQKVLFFPVTRWHFLSCIKAPESTAMTPVSYERKNKVAKGVPLLERDMASLSLPRSNLQQLEKPFRKRLHSRTSWPTLNEKIRTRKQENNWSICALCVCVCYCAV